MSQQEDPYRCAQWLSTAGAMAATAVGVILQAQTILMACWHPLQHQLDRDLAVRSCTILSLVFDTLVLLASKVICLRMIPPCKIGMLASRLNAWEADSTGDGGNSRSQYGRPQPLERKARAQIEGLACSPGKPTSPCQVCFLKQLLINTAV